jgi:hypothetical protein
MRPKERQVYLESQIASYWTDLSGKSHYYYQKRAMVDKLLNRFQADSTKVLVAELLDKKLKLITRKEQNKLQELTVLWDNQIPPKYSRIDTLDNSVINSEGIRTKFCLVTGIDISCQALESKYISSNSLKKLFHSDQQRFRQIQMKFGPLDDNLKLEDLCNRIAHRIRNYMSDQWRGLRRKKERYHGMNPLFSELPYYSRRTLASISELKVGRT